MIEVVLRWPIDAENFPLDDRDTSDAENLIGFSINKDV